MTNLFQYTETEGQGWLVEKPEMEKPVFNEKNYPKEVDGFHFMNDMGKYNNHIATLRRFKYDYPDPQKEMIEDQDFFVSWVGQKAMPIKINTPSARTYSEQEYWSLVGELKGTLRGIIDFYNPNPKVKESLEKRIKELEALKLNNPL